MIDSRTTWKLGIAFFYGIVVMALYGVPGLFEDENMWRIAHGFWYGGFGVGLLAVLARNFPHARPDAWRVATLMVGALAAGVGLWVMKSTWGMFTASDGFDAWMAALLGLAIAVMLPRWLPASVTCRWLALERRHAPPSQI
jgi:hypothetical protein